MAFEILNEAASVVYVLAGENRYPQAEPDKVDFDILAQGIDGEGVVSGCDVTPQGAPDTTVAVAAGVVRIAGTDVAFAGGNVNCGAANPALPRFDLIIINAAGAALAVNGVAAAVPVFPGGAAVPGTSVVIAAVWRAANDDTITAADLVDKRCLLLGGALGTAPTLIGIVGGIATPNRSCHTLSAQAGAADDLDGLAVSSIITNGEIVIIYPDAGDTITVKHNALGGADAQNILCIGNADIVLDDDHDFAIFIYRTAIGAGSWTVLGGGAAGGAGNTLDAAYDQGGGGAGRIVTVDSGAIELRHVSNTTMLATRDPGDAVDRFALSRDGDMSWGSGAGAADVVLSRVAANHLALAAGDRLRVNYLADTAGNDRIRLQAANPQVLITGRTQTDGATGNVGIRSAVAADDSVILNVSPGFAHAVAFGSVDIIKASPTITSSVTGFYRAIAGIFSVNVTGGGTGVFITGLEFIALARSTSAHANTVAQLWGVITSYQAYAAAGTLAVTTAGGLQIASPTGTGLGNITITTSYGIWVKDPSFNVSVLGTAYSLKLDEINFGTNRYLIEAGPATPYLRLIGGANPGAGQTNLYLKEQVTLRRVQWMDPGAGGANFAGGERVMILV